MLTILLDVVNLDVVDGQELRDLALEGDNVTRIGPHLPRGCLAHCPAKHLGINRCVLGLPAHELDVSVTTVTLATEFSE